MLCPGMLATRPALSHGELVGQLLESPVCVEEEHTARGRQHLEMYPLHKAALWAHTYTHTHTHTHTHMRTTIPMQLPVLA